MFSVSLSEFEDDIMDVGLQHTIKLVILAVIFGLNCGKTVFSEFLF